MRNLNEAMALFAIKIERIKHNALTKLSALQDELSQPTEAERAPVVNEYGLAGLSAMSREAMQQYAISQAQGMMNDRDGIYAAMGQLQTGRQAGWL